MKNKNESHVVDWLINYHNMINEKLYMNDLGFKIVGFNNNLNHIY